MAQLSTQLVRVKIKGKLNSQPHDLERTFNSLQEAVALLAPSMSDIIIIDCNSVLTQETTPGWHLNDLGEECVFSKSSKDTTHGRGLVVAKAMPYYETYCLHYDETCNYTEHNSRVSKQTVLPYQTYMNIFESHKALVLKAKTDNVYVLDADLKLDSLEVPQAEPYLGLWNVRNPFNDLVYGHGGPKFFNKKLFDKVDYGNDMTLSFPIKLRDTCVGTHSYNWSRYSTWRTALRESFKLSLKTDDESNLRLQAWTTLSNPDVINSEHNLAGARAGVLYSKVKQYNIINDYDWLFQAWIDYLRVSDEK